MRGDGFLYRCGSVWYGSYNENGKRVRRSLKTENEEVAKKRLQKLRGAVTRGEIGTGQRATVGELLDDLLVHLEVRGAASRSKVKSHVKTIRTAFGHLPASALETAAVERYQQLRLGEGRKPATVNRELEALRQAFNIAAKRSPPKVRTVPYIPLLRVDNARQGFLSRADFEALLAGLADPDVRDFVEWFWWTGMRPNEIRQLTWEMYDRETATLTLAPEAEKTRRGRALKVVGPLAKIMKRRQAKRLLSTTLIFHRTSHRQPGKPVKDFRVQWKQALATASLPADLLPYDLRRSAVRNMIRAGVREGVVMKISGHRTRATFDRYNITSGDDLEEAVTAVAAYVGALSTKRRVSELRHGAGAKSRK